MTRRQSAVDGGRPLGLPCPEHASTVVNGRCYFHVRPQDPEEARVFAGFAPDPFTLRREYVEQHRGWRPLTGTAFDRFTQHQLEEFDRTDGAARITLGAETLVDLQAIIDLAPGDEENGGVMSELWDLEADLNRTAKAAIVAVGILEEAALVVLAERVNEAAAMARDAGDEESMQRLLDARTIVLFVMHQRVDFAAAGMVDEVEGFLRDGDD